MSQKDMEALVVGSRRQINLDVLLPNNNRADIQVPSAGGELHFTLLRENNEIHRDDYYNGYTDTSGSPQPTRLVRQSNGRYYYPFGLNGVEQTECGLYQAIWDYRIANQFDYETEWQLIRVIPTSSLELIEDLRLILDKALKYYNEKVPTPTRIGYSTGMLVKYLELGLAGINSQPPYPTWASLELFPKAYKSLLIKAALYWGVTSQLLYAIDTDITNYSDNGLSYVKQHAPQLAAYLASIKDDLKNDIPKFKMQFVAIGSVVMRNTISYRWDTLIQNAPNGATLRGFFTTPL
jgi:hypothetical protein